MLLSIGLRLGSKVGVSTSGVSDELLHGLLADGHVALLWVVGLKLLDELLEPIGVAGPVEDCQRENAIVSRFGFFGLVLEVVIKGGLGGRLDLGVEVLAFDPASQVDEALQVI